jgi:dTMP kinase
MNKFKYLLIEGIDASGKTTLAKALVTRLQDYFGAGKVMPTAFPNRATPIGYLIRDSFDGKVSINTNTMWWLLLAEAVEMDPVIENQLAHGYWVVSDRHVQISSRIYQEPIYGAATINTVIKAARLRKPDRIYILDVPAEVALERRTKRGEARNERYEPDEVDGVIAQRRAYNFVADQDETAIRLDGTKSIEHNLDVIWADLGLPEGAATIKYRRGEVDGRNGHPPAEVTEQYLEGYSDGIEKSK